MLDAPIIGIKLTFVNCGNSQPQKLYKLSGNRLTSHQVQMLAREHDGSVLIGHGELLDHNAHITPLGVWALFADGGDHRDGVVDKHGLDKAQAVIAIRHGMRIDVASSHPHRHTKHQRPVRHALPKWLRFAPFRVHVMRKKVTRLAGMGHDVTFGDGAAKRGTTTADLIFFKILLANHSVPFVSAMRNRA